MKTKVIVITTDMGNGAAFCEACDYNLDGGDPTVTIPLHCPKCGAEFTDHEFFPYNFGGSDF